MLTGIITALIVIATIYAYVLLRPVPPIDADFGSRKVSFTTGVPAAEVFRIVENAEPSDRYRLGRSDAGRGRVILHDGMSWSSFGFYYPVDIAASADGQTHVTVGIKSKYPLQFGPLVKAQQEKANQKLADHLKARIEAKRVTA